MLAPWQISQKSKQIRPLKLARGHFLQFLFLCLILAVNPLLAANQQDFSVENGGYIVQLNNRIQQEHRANDLFVPASSIKILTALAALTTLGEEYRFSTSLYYDRNQLLGIKGGGDPFLTAEELKKAVIQLKAKGLQRVSGIILDDSAFQLEHALPDGSLNTDNPYDTGNGALAVNFNTLPFRKDKKGILRIEDPHTPVLPLTREMARNVGVGSHRINIFSHENQGSLPVALRYTAELLAELLRNEGIQVTGTFRGARIPSSLAPVYTITSEKNVTEMVAQCLKYSSNFIANQLALTAGARAYGYPATWQKAEKLLSEHAYNRLHISPQALHIVEGSGLSRQTRISPAAMLKILEAFEPWKSLLPEKHAALLKSGTMTGVYCYAGYKEMPTGTARLVILLNQDRNTRDVLLDALVQNK